MNRFELYRCKSKGHKWLSSTMQLEQVLLEDGYVDIECPYCHTKDFETLDVMDMEETKINLMEVVK